MSRVPDGHTGCGCSSRREKRKTVAFWELLALEVGRMAMMHGEAGTQTDTRLLTKTEICTLCPMGHRHQGWA